MNPNKFTIFISLSFALG